MKVWRNKGLKDLDMPNGTVMDRIHKANVGRSGIWFWIKKESFGTVNNGVHISF